MRWRRRGGVGRVEKVERVERVEKVGMGRGGGVGGLVRGCRVVFLGLWGKEDRDGDG